MCSVYATVLLLSGNYLLASQYLTLSYWPSAAVVLSLTLLSHAELVSPSNSIIIIRRQSFVFRAEWHWKG